MIEYQTNHLKYLSDMRIGFHTPVIGAGVNMGYGYSAVELIKSWQRQGVPVWGFDSEAPIQFSYGQPHTYGDYVDGALNIGFTFWESDGVPEAWPHYMNQMDEIWTACQANADWFRDAGVERPIRVLHLGVNSEHYPVRMRKLQPRETFKFLHIGEPTPRKGGEETYRAFVDAFSSSDRVSLTIKGKPRFEVDDERVEVIDEYLSVEDMRQLYLDHHAMIYPTYGEGFGLIPFQAAATGMPVAVTDWSAPKDFMEFCYPIAINGLVDADYLPHEGQWASPRHDCIVRIMRYFYYNRSIVLPDSYVKGQYIQRYHSWDSVGKMALEFMMDSLKRLPS